MPDRPRVIILDDYQSAALSSGPWERLEGRATVETINQPIADTDALVAALAGADVVVAMRERTRFDAAVSALVMARHADHLAALARVAPDAPARLEGEFWLPPSEGQRPSAGGSAGRGAGPSIGAMTAETAFEDASDA